MCKGNNSMNKYTKSFNFIFCIYSESFSKVIHHEPLVGPRYCFIEHWIIQKLRNKFHIRPSSHVLLILYSHWKCYKCHNLYMALKKLSLSHTWGKRSHPHFDIYHKLNVRFTYSIKPSYNNNTRNIIIYL